MGKETAEPTVTASLPALQAAVIVFGFDDSEKPHASWFSAAMPSWPNGRPA